jgi:hypothetical protein
MIVSVPIVLSTIGVTMPRLRVIKNGVNFTLRGSGKADKPNDEHVGDVEIPDDLMPLLRDSATGVQALGFYSKAFGGEKGLADVVDMFDSEPFQRLLRILITAAEAARLAYSSQEFELTPPEAS